jgi:hypothetical protein
MSAVHACLLPSQASVDVWIHKLLAEDFCASCREDRFCVTCAAAFCNHCCARHHRGQGHEVVVRGRAGVLAAPRAGDRDSFCLDCAAGFSAALCAHHGGHETASIVVCEGRHCMRCTGFEPWFAWFDGIEVRYSVALVA